jgi:hypothetical protein
MKNALTHDELASLVPAELKDDANGLRAGFNSLSAGIEALGQKRMGYAQQLAMLLSPFKVGDEVDQHAFEAKVRGYVYMPYGRTHKIRITDIRGGVRHDELEVRYRGVLVRKDGSDGMHVSFEWRP